MFKITEELWNSKQKFTLSNTESQESLEVLAGFGASIHRLKLKHEGELLEIINGYQNAQELETNASFAYKGSFLFPYANRLEDGRYTFEGKNYQLPINEVGNNHAHHGLYYHRVFNLLSQHTTATYAELVLKTDTTEVFEYYPFRLELQITFRLHHGKITILTEITNLDTCNAPVAMGWHPYFKLGDDVKDLVLEIPENKYIEVNERMIPIVPSTFSKSLPTRIPLAEAKLDDGCLVEDHKVWVVIHNTVLDKNIIMDFIRYDGVEEMYIQAYIPPSRDCIAVEPQTCAINAFNNGMGLKVLAPKEAARYECAISLS